MTCILGHEHPSRGDRARRVHRDSKEDVKVTLSRIACTVALAALAFGPFASAGIAEAGGLWLPVGYPLMPAPVVVAAPVVVPAPVLVSRAVVVARPVVPAPVVVAPTPHQYKHAYRSARRASRWGW